LGFAIGRAIKPSYVEVDDLNHVSMSGHRGHSHFVQKEFHHFLLLGAIEGGLIDAVVHQLDCDALVRGQVDG
jgi:hypothetical protein